MKKLTSALLASSLLLGAIPSVTEAAPAPLHVNVVLNGKKVWFPDSHPYVHESGRTVVPVRFVTENLGATVQWIGETRTVVIQLNDKEIRLTVGEDKATVNGETLQLDTVILEKGGRVFVPLRFVSEALQAKVTWSDPRATVYIETPGYTMDPFNTDFWDRITRKEDLPKNAADYSFVLEDVPNAMYEMKYVDKFGTNKTPKQVFAKQYITPQVLDLWAETVRKYYTQILNVDYRTIDESWGRSMYQHRHLAVDHFQDVRDYIEWVKWNHVQIEGYLDAEPTMVYDGTNLDYIRARFKIRVVNYDKWHDLLFDSNFKALTQLEKGVWYEGYADISLSSDSWAGEYTSWYYTISQQNSLFTNCVIWRAQ